jgi:hypothetical protein
VRYFADILNYFKMPARWNVETTCKFVQVYTENEFLRNMHSLISHSFIHSQALIVQDGTLASLSGFL